MKLKPGILVRFALVVLVAVLVGLALRKARRSAQLSDCRSNLRSIAVALVNYHEIHGEFPPAYIADEHGRPMHSWRVLLLPFLQDTFFQGFPLIYRQYRFDEPWNGPNNKALLQTSPWDYQCPSYADTDHTTSYVMVVGEGLLAEGPRTSRRHEDITDDPVNSIAIVEIANSGIHWMEPRDFNYDDLALQINSDRQRSISSYHEGGAHVALLDCWVRFLKDDTPPEALNAMLTIAGGEQSQILNEYVIKERTEAIRQDSINRRYHYCVRGKAHYRNGAYGQAIRDFTEALGEPNMSYNVEAYRGRSLAYKEQGEHDLAAADQDEADRLDRADADRFFGFALECRADEKYERAISWFTSTLRRVPDHEAAYRERAATYQLMGEDEKADADIARAKELQERAAEDDQDEDQTE